MNQNGKFPSLLCSANNLGCIRDGYPVFANIDFSVKSGEALIVRGPNGSGKSSLLMILSGILPFHGKLAFTHADTPPNQTNDNDTPISQLIHHVGHQNAMKSDLTLVENLKFWIALSGGNDAAIPEALSKAGLAGLDNFTAGHLSAGQKHRLSLARLLVSPRPIWILDEPSSALDTQGDIWIAQLIDTHIAQGGMAITATHRSIQLGAKTPHKTLTMKAISSRANSTYENSSKARP